MRIIDKPSGFIVSYDDRTEQVQALQVIKDVTFTKLSKKDTKYAVSGVAIEDGMGCDQQTLISKNTYFLAEFEQRGAAFVCTLVRARINAEKGANVLIR